MPFDPTYAEELRRQKEEEERRRREAEAQRQEQLRIRQQEEEARRQQEQRQREAEDQRAREEAERAAAEQSRQAEERQAAAQKAEEERRQQLEKQRLDMLHEKEMKYLEYKSRTQQEQRYNRERSEWEQYQQNLANVKDTIQVNPTERGLYALALDLYRQDEEKGRTALGMISQLQADPTSPLYNPYAQPSNQAVGRLQALGIDCSNIDNEWIEKNSYLMQYWTYNEGTNTPKKPGKKATKEEQQAYEYYQILLAQNNTNKALEEQAALKHELEYWANAKDRNYSDEEILDKIDWSKYSTLSSMRGQMATRKGTPMELNTAVNGWSDDWAYGVLWAARNNGGTGNNIGDMVASVIGKGNQWKQNDEISQKLNPGNKETYSPYSVGSTMEKERLYFGVDSFNQKWIDDNWEKYMGGDDETAKEMFINVIEANKYTDTLDEQLGKMNSRVDYLLTRFKNPEKILNLLKNDDTYSALFELDDSLDYGDTRLKNTTRAVDYRWKDIEDKVRQKCYQNNARSLVETVVSGITAVTDQTRAALQMIQQGAQDFFGAPAMNNEQTQEKDQEEDQGKGQQPDQNADTVQPKEEQTPVPTEQPEPTTGSEPVSNTPGPKRKQQKGTNHPAPESSEPIPASTPAPTATPTPILTAVMTENEREQEEYGRNAMEDLTTTIEEKGTDAEKAALTSGKTTWFDRAVEIVQNAQGNFLRSNREQATQGIVNNYFGQSSVIREYESLQQRLQNMQQELEAINQERQGLQDRKSTTESIGNLTREQYESLSTYFNMPEGQDYDWDWARQTLSEDPNNEDALKELYYRVTGTSITDAGGYEDQVSALEKAKLWYKYMAQPQMSPIDQIVEEANWSAEEESEPEDDLEIEQNGMILHLHLNDQGQYEYMGAYDQESGAFYNTDLKSDVEERMGYKPMEFLTDDEEFRLGLLEQRSSELEQQIEDGKDNLGVMEGDYRAASIQQNMQKMRYMVSTILDRASGGDADASLLNAMDNIFAVSQDYVPTNFTPYSAYEIGVSSGEYSLDDAYTHAENDCFAYNNAAKELESQLAMMDQYGVQMSDKERNNVQRYIDSLKRDAKSAMYFMLGQEEDFDSVVESTREKAENGELGEKAKMIATKSTSLDLWRGMFDVTYKDELVKMDETLKNMSDDEQNRFLYLLGKDGEQAAMDYFNVLTDPDYGVITVRSSENRVKELQEFASQNGWTALTATGLSLLSNVMGAAPALFYELGQKLTGGEVSYHNRAFMYQDTTSALRGGAKEWINEVTGNNPFFDMLYEAATSSADSMINAALTNSAFDAVGKVLGGTKLAQLFGKIGAAVEQGAENGGIVAKAGKFIIKVGGDMTHAASMGLNAASAAYRKAVLNADPDKAAAMFTATFFAETASEGVTFSNLHDAFVAGSSEAKNFVIEFFKNAGEEFLGEAANEYIEQNADRLIMGSLSEYDQTVQYYLDQQYPESVAKKLAEKAMWKSVLMSGAVGALSSGIGSATSYVAGKVSNRNERNAAVNNQQTAMPAAEETQSQERRVKDLPVNNQNQQQTPTAEESAPERRAKDIPVNNQNQQTPAEETPVSERRAKDIPVNNQNQTTTTQETTPTQERPARDIPVNNQRESTQEQIPTQQELNQLGKDMQTLTGADGAQPESTAVSITSVLNTGNQAADKAAGQTIVSVMANGDTSLAAEAIQQMLMTNWGTQPTTKMAIQQASLTNGAGHQALQNIFNRVQNGQQITAEHVDAVVAGLIQDRRSDPEGFDRSLQNAVTENRTANAALQIASTDEYRKNILTAETALDDARTQLANAQQASEEANNHVDAIAENLRAAEQEYDPSNEETAAPLEQITNKLLGAKTAAEQQEAAVEKQQQNVEAKAKALSDIQDDVMFKARQEANAVIEEQNRQAEERKAREAELAAEQEKQRQIEEKQAEERRLEQEEIDNADNADFDAYVEQLKKDGWTPETAEEVQRVRDMWNELRAESQAAEMGQTQNALPGSEQMQNPAVEGEQTQTVTPEGEQIQAETPEAEQGPKLTRKQERYQKTLNNIGKKFGVNIKTVKSIENGANGRYDPKTNTILLNENLSINDAMNFVLGHELTHIAEKSGTYGDMANALLRSKYGKDADYAKAIENLKKNKGTPTNALEADILKYKQLYDQTLHQTHSYEEAAQELIADRTGALIDPQDTSYRQRKEIINYLAQEEPSVARRILDSIKQFIRKAVGINGDWLKNAKATVDMLETALNEVQNQPLQQEGEIKHSLMEFPDGKRFVDLDIMQDEFDNLSPDEMRKKARSIIREYFMGNVVGIDNKAFVNGQTANEFAYPSKFISDDEAKVKMRASTELDNLIDAGEYDRHEEDGRDGHFHDNVVDGFDYYKTIFKIGNEYFEGEVNIANLNKGKKFHDVTKIRNITQDIMSSYGQNPKSQFLRNVSMENVAQDKRIVKPAAVDSDGTELTGEFEDGTQVKYSLNSWTEEEQKRVRNDLLKKGFSSQEADKWIKDTNSLAAMIAEDRTRLDFEASDNQVFLKPNNDYHFTLDASTLCAKRLLYQGTFDYVQHALPDEVFTPEDLIDLVNIMNEMGYETPCGICYVESRRRWLDTYAQKFLDTLPEEGRPSIDDLTTSDGLEKLRHSDPDMYKAFVDAMNKKGTANPKVVQLRTEYRGDIGKLTKKDIQNVKDIGGLRIQSFSDFETPHLLDMVQAVLDMSSAGLTSQAYTKVPNFAWAFGDTGIKINLSLIGKGTGLDENGNLVFDNREGIDFDEAMKLRERYNKNVGTILVGINDEHIIAAMGDPRIDFIIPFHKSGWSAEELRKMPTLNNYNDYTSTQNEMLIVGDKKHKVKEIKDLGTKAFNNWIVKEGDDHPGYQVIEQANGKYTITYDVGYETESFKKHADRTKEKFSNFEPVGANAYWEFDKSGEWNARKYLQMCADAGRIPKFSQFLVDNGDGTFSLPEGNDKRSTAIREGYWKTLIDFKMYENDGYGRTTEDGTKTDVRGSEQTEVTPNINMAEAYRIMNEYQLGRQMPNKKNGAKGAFIPMNSNNDVPVAIPAAERYIDLIRRKREGNKPTNPNDTLKASPSIDVGSLGESWFGKGPDEGPNMNAATAFGATQAPAVIGNEGNEYVEPSAEQNRMAIDAETGDTVRYSLPEDNEYLSRVNNGEADEAGLEYDTEVSNGPETQYGSRTKFSLRVTDPEELDFLNNQETIKTYKTMQMVDGKLYPPMAAVVAGNMEDYSVIGQWEKATEHPELIKNGNMFTLNKGRGQGSLAARYNPYMHSSNLMINDQFAGAYNRPDLVTVECEVPVSESNGAYHAEYAKDSTGWHSWHTGPVAGQLRNTNGTERQVFLSRWIKPVRIVPESEVADHYAELLKGTDIQVPDNVVPPALLEELKKKGVPISQSGKVSDSARYSLPSVKPSDAPYLSAVNHGDMEEAQRMVDKKAEEAGYVKAGYHGTLNGGFTIFDKAKAGIGGNSGAGFYFSSNPSDSDANYSDVEGADNWFKANHLADRILEEFQNSDEEDFEYEGYQITEGMPYEEVVDIAKKILTKNPQTYNVYLDPGKAYIRDFNNSTNLIEDAINNFDESLYSPDDYDSEDDYYEDLSNRRAEEIWQSISDAVYQAYSDIADNYEIYGVFDAEKIIGKLAEIAMDYENLTWNDLIKILSEEYIDIGTYDMDEPTDGSHEIARAIVEAFGFDSIEDREVSKKFNQLKNMGNSGDTVHYIMFNPNQIKLADPVTYDNEGNVIPLSERFNDQNSDIRYSLPSDDILKRHMQQYLANGGSLAQQTNLPGRAVPESSNLPGTPGMGPQRQFGHQTAQNSDALHQEVKDYLYNHSSYTPDSNQAQIDRSIDWVRSQANENDPDGYRSAVEQVTSGTFDYRSADGQARMLTVMGMAVLRGDTATELQIADAYNKQGTDLGRQLQARKLFRLMTPIGRRSVLQQQVSQINENYGRMGSNNRVALSEGTLKAAENAQTEEEFHNVQKAAAKELAAQMPANWKEKLTGWRMLSMLGNPRTHIRNFVGNALFVPAVSIKNKAGALMEAATRQEHRTKTLAPFLSKDIKEFARQDAKAMKDVLTGDAKYNEDNAVDRERKAFNGILQSIIDFNSDKLEKEDWFFLKGHYRRALGGWMQANGYTVEQMQNNPSLLQTGRVYAIQEAQKATYRDFNGLAQRLNQMSRNPQTTGQKVLAFGVDAVLPFKKTPANIMKRGLEYSPVGIARSLTTDLFHLKQYNDYQNGKLKVLPDKAITPNQFIDHLCSGLTGTAIMAVGALLGHAGIISCGLGDDDDRIEKEKGNQEYSFKFSILGQDYTFTIDWAAPMSMPFFVGAAVQEQLANQEGFDIEELVNAFGNISEPVFNLSMLDGVNSLLKITQNSDDANTTLTQIGAKVASNYVTSYWPSLFGAIARTIDDTRRKSYVESGKGTGVLGTFRYAWEQTENKIPGLSQTNIPIRDVFGNPDTSSPAERVLENFILPGYVNQYNTDPVLNEIGKVYDDTGDASLVPKDPSKSFSYKNQKYVLTAEEWDAYKKERGQTAYNMLKELMQTDEYQNADSDLKASMIGKVWDYADKVGKKAAVPSYEVTNMTVENIANTAVSDDYNSIMLKALDSGDTEAYDVAVEALHQHGVEDKQIKEKIANIYRDQYKEAYLKDDVVRMAELEELLDSTGFSFDYDNWKKQADR